MNHYVLARPLICFSKPHTETMQNPTLYISLTRGWTLYKENAKIFEHPLQASEQVLRARENIRRGPGDIRYLPDPYYPSNIGVFSI